MSHNLTKEMEGLQSVTTIYPASQPVTPQHPLTPSDAIISSSSCFQQEDQAALLGTFNTLSTLVVSQSIPTTTSIIYGIFTSSIISNEAPEPLAVDP